MTLHELIQILNPIVENKYTRHKSRRVVWAFEVKGWLTGERNEIKTNLVYIGRDISKRVNAGYAVVNENSVNKICFYEDMAINVLLQLKELLPEEVELDLVRRD